MCVFDDHGDSCGVVTNYWKKKGKSLIVESAADCLSARVVSHFVALGGVDDVIKLVIGTGDGLDLEAEVALHFVNEMIVAVEHGSG
jgi:hypothetical protein